MKTKTLLIIAVALLAMPLPFVAAMQGGSDGDCYDHVLWNNCQPGIEWTSTTGSYCSGIFPNTEVRYQNIYQNGQLCYQHSDYCWNHACGYP